MRFNDLSRRLSMHVLLAILAAGSAAVARQDEPRRPIGEATPKAVASVRDTAGLFSVEGRNRANELLGRIERTTGVPVVIETVKSLDGKLINEAVIDHARDSGTKGVYLLVSQRDKDVSRPLVHREYASKFPEERRGAIRRAMLDEFNKGRFDTGLIKAIEETARTLGVPVVVPSGLPAPVTVPSGESTDSPLVVRGRVGLTLSGARRVVSGAEAKAAEMGLKVNIAVVDDGGHLLTFARMDGARPASGYTAMTKATAAATFRQATGPVGVLPGVEPNVLLNLSLQNAASASGGKVTTLYGGVPILVDDQIIGAVGVGGGTGEQDADVARAGIQAFLDELKKGSQEDHKEEAKPAQEE